LKTEYYRSTKKTVFCSSAVSCHSETWS